MKTLLLTSYGSRLGGGLYSTMTKYSQAMLNIGIEPVIISFTDEFWLQDKSAYGKVRTINYCRTNIPIVKQLGFSINIHRLLQNEQTDIIHQQGIWMYYSYATLVEKHRNPHCKVIIEPHGMLDSWALRNSAWKKKIVGYLFEYRNLSSADCIHALCKSEYESIRQFGLKNPVAIIPNGITLPLNPKYERVHNKKILLFIGRIHPKKGLKELILGLAIIKQQMPHLFNSWTVHIAGWDQKDHINELNRLIEIYNLKDDIKFMGPLYGKAKEQELCRANAFILPSFSEGLPMAVLEAWAYELPVIMTDYCNIPEGFENSCAIRIKPSPSDISEALISFFRLSDIEMIKMGKRGKELVSQNFTWEIVAEQTLKLYQYLLGKRTLKPSFVYED